MELRLSLNSENIVPQKKISQAEHCGILIVEDDKIWRQLYKINLFKSNKKRSYKFYEASNGREALILLAQHSSSIKLVILDLVMPTMDGQKFIDFVVRKWGLNHFGIFIITAHGDEKIRQQTQLYGVRAFIDKQSINFAETSSLIAQFLNINEKPKGISTGFYLENRPSANGERQDIYLRWNLGEEVSESFCLGPLENIEGIDLPNLRSKR